MKKVDRYTRAGNDGRLIKCPHCKKIKRVYHFAWSAVKCSGCSNMVDKSEWDIV